ncbi:MAG: hypothetical protein H5T69_19530, partial [Chloroflexi bacterium]|nr:hypothetical protein [Chloroflexota bacterium]
DTLDDGLAFVDFVPGFTNSNPAEVTLSGSTTPVITNNGRTITWNLGTITNTNTDNATAEVLTFGYRAVVLNVVGNQSGILLNNSAVFSWTGGSLGAVSAPNVTVIEPALDAVKMVNRSTADAGDWITYTITLKHAGSSGADAFDVTFSDPLPKTGSGASLIVSPSFSVADSAGIVTAASFELVGSDSTGWTLQTRPGVSFDMPWSTSRTITLTVWGTVSYLAAPSQSVQNTATVYWTSLDGAPGQRSAYNTSSTERTGADGPGGALNDYADTGSATFTVFAPAPAKSIVATSEAHTTSVAGTERVAIGEIVRYRLVARLAEGTAVDLQFQDQLPTGLRFLNDGTAKVAFVSNGPIGITSTTLSGVGLQQTGNESNVASITPTFVLPDEAVSSSATTNNDTYGSGTDPYFKFGTVVNNDSDSDQEFIVVEFNAVVENIAGNQA